jgi:hypothetical protein
MKKQTSTPAEEATPQLEASLTNSSDWERYRTVFLAALTGFACNPSLGGARHEELAAEVASRTVAGRLDLHPTER